MELYSKWGWTEDDFWLAFRKNPRFMPLSANSFSSEMDFIVNKMGSLATVVAAGDKVFLDRYVIRYQDHVPELRSIFQGKMGLRELGLGFCS